MEVKDQATATEAALHLDAPDANPPKPGEPPAPRTGSTTAKLFPEFVGEDGLLFNRPVRAFVDKDKALPPAMATPAPASASATPPATAPTVTGTLDLSKLPPETLVRTKVDGVEMDVPVKEYLKGIQLERHLTIQAQKLAEQRAALEAERAAFRQPAAPIPVPRSPDAPPAPPVKGEDPRIAAMEAELAMMRPIIAKQQYETGLQELAKQARETFGTDDFMVYVPKIQEFVNTELAKPEVAANPILRNALDQKAFWYGKYQEMKLRDMMAAKPSIPVSSLPPPSAPVVTPLVVPRGAMAVVDRNGNPVAVPVIESSGGAPSRESPDANWQGRYQAAFDAAKKTGRTEDWMEVFRLKREGGQG